MVSQILNRELFLLWFRKFEKIVPVLSNFMNENKNNVKKNPSLQNHFSGTLKINSKGADDDTMI